MFLYRTGQGLGGLRLRHIPATPRQCVSRRPAEREVASTQRQHHDRDDRLVQAADAQGRLPQSFGTGYRPHLRLHPARQLDQVRQALPQDTQDVIFGPGREVRFARAGPHQERIHGRRAVHRPHCSPFLP
jgi:hypothetical protein